MKPKFPNNSNKLATVLKIAHRIVTKITIPAYRIVQRGKTQNDKTQLL